MYSSVPIINTKVLYSAIFKVMKADSKKIIENLELLIGKSKLDIIQEDIDDYINFSISSYNKKELEIFYFKIYSIANDNYVRRNKIENK